MNFRYLQWLCGPWLPEENWRSNTFYKNQDNYYIYYILLYITNGSLLKMLKVIKNTILGIFVLNCQILCIKHLIIYFMKGEILKMNKEEKRAVSKCLCFSKAHILLNPRLDKRLTMCGESHQKHHTSFSVPPSHLLYICPPSSLYCKQLSSIFFTNQILL